MIMKIENNKKMGMLTRNNKMAQATFYLILTKVVEEPTMLMNLSFSSHMRRMHFLDNLFLEKTIGADSAGHFQALVLDGRISSQGQFCTFLTAYISL
jgi:hypothetical protein